MKAYISNISSGLQYFVPDRDSFRNYTIKCTKLLEKLINTMVMGGNNADEEEPSVMLCFYFKCHSCHSSFGGT